MKRILDACADERRDLLDRIAELEEHLARLDRIAELAHTGELSEFVRDRAAMPVEKLKPEPKRAVPRTLPPVLRSTPQPPRREQMPAAEITARVERVLSLVAELEPVRFGDLQRRADLPIGQLKTTLKALRDAGKVTSTGSTVAARYHLTATLDRQIAEKNGKGAHTGARQRCRDDLLQTFRSEPAKWTEQRIADSGAWDRELVAEVCGDLLDEGAVAMLPDGTYAVLAAVAA